MNLGRPSSRIWTGPRILPPQTLSKALDKDWLEWLLYWQEACAKPFTPDLCIWTSFLFILADVSYGLLAGRWTWDKMWNTFPCDVGWAIEGVWYFGNIKFYLNTNVSPKQTHYSICFRTHHTRWTCMWNVTSVNWLQSLPNESCVAWLDNVTCRLKCCLNGVKKRLHSHNRLRWACFLTLYNVPILSE